ncbi:hypothetical protein [Spongiimicrobium sp. 3-5]|uniref:hypothetical protein n=1 Tax=Spongiimicrobium sp. 3-5 TaxID=3332596 RepID=UPI00397FE020
MISSIFGKTKPINYIILLGFLFIFYWFSHFVLFKSTYNPEQLVLPTFVLAILLFSIFWVNFIIKRNKITGTNSFAILFYTLLIIVFPKVLMDNNGILCSFFLLLSTRRLLSLKSLKNIKHKIYDATMWISVASLFYDWALLYLILVFVSVYFYEPKNIRNWLVPFTAIFTVVMLTVCILILAGNLDFLAQHYTFSIDTESAYFMDWRNSGTLLGYILIISLAGLLAFLGLGKAGTGRINTMRLVAIAYFLGLILTALKSSQDTFPVIVTFFPASIFLTNYVEIVKRPYAKEAILMVSVLVPFVLLVSGIIVK